MGVLDNIRKIIRYNRYVGSERKFESELIKNTIEDTKFIHEYSTFVEGLKSSLDKVFDEKTNFKEVFYTPTKPEMAKYFRALMDDKEFKEYYNIRTTAGGEFAFSLKTLENDLETD